MENEKDSDIIDYPVAGALIGVKPATLCAWVSRHQVPHIRISGRLVRFSRRALIEWLKSKEVPCGAKVGAR